MKKIYSVIILTTLLPVIAFANSLTINNVTSLPVSVKMGNNCVQPIPNGSIMKYPSSVLTSDAYCGTGSTTASCFIMVYKSENCSDAPIVTFAIDSNDGIYNEMPTDRNYTLSSSGKSLPDSVIYIRELNR